MVKARHVEGNKYFGKPTRVKKPRAERHRILLIKSEDGEWYWLYTINRRTVTRSFRTYPKLADASRTARTFRDLLAARDLCEIVPPENYVYSGD